MIASSDMGHLVLNNTYTATEEKQMLKISADSIYSGLNYSKPIDIDLNQFSEKLNQHRATFVTLQISGRLRGCIGSLVAHRALAEDIAENAFAAAFKDHRFNALTASGYEQLEIHISILSPSEEINFDSEQSLLEQIQPGHDGLIISDQGHRATFLPSVWESLPLKMDFLSELKQKAGLGKTHWSNTIQVERYSTYRFGDTVTNVLSA